MTLVEDIANLHVKIALLEQNYLSLFTTEKIDKFRRIFRRIFLRIFRRPDLCHSVMFHFILA